MLSVIMLNVIMLSVILLTVIMLSVVVTLQRLSLRPYPQIFLKPEICCPVKAHNAELSVVRPNVVALLQKDLREQKLTNLQHYRS